MLGFIGKIFFRNYVSREHRKSDLENDFYFSFRGAVLK